MRSIPFVPAGLWVPIVTPITSDGEVDPGSLRRLADRLLEDGIDGLVALGTTGEPATLSADERDLVADVCSAASAAAGRPLIVGAGSNSTIGTVDEIRRLAARVPVAAALIVVPYYTRPSRRAVIEHFHLVADESPVPIIAYNVPYRTGSSLDADALVEIGSHPNVVGLKQSVGAIDADTLGLLRRLPTGFDVLAGDDAFITPSILMGATGAISAAANLRTRDFVAMVSAARAGDVGTARTIAESLLPMIVAGFAEPNPSVWKAGLCHRGDIATAELRRPMTRATDGALADLLGAC